MPIDTAYQQHITCPHCGYKDLDSWDHGFDRNDDTETQECKSCTQEFIATFHVEVSYSTKKLEETDG